MLKNVSIIKIKEALAVIPTPQQTNKILKKEDQLLYLEIVTQKTKKIKKKIKKLKKVLDILPLKGYNISTK